MLGVGKIVTGTIGLVGKTYYLSLSIINVETGRIENVSEDECKCEIDDLIKSSKRLVKTLLGENIAEQKPSEITDINDLMQKGYALTQGKKWNEAREIYNKVIELKPDFADAHYWRGYVYYNLGNHQQAVNDLSKVIEAKPVYVADAYYWRGVAYYNLGNHQQAVNDLSKVIEAKPAYVADAYYWRGVAYYNLGNHQQAVNDLSKVIEAKPAYVADAYYWRGYTYYTLGIYQQAIKDFDKAIELRPNFEWAYYWRGYAYYNSGNHQQATGDFKISARLGNKAAQDFLKGQGINW